jgi:RpiB/LacA/LacB family sugar-phosphate isomerase
MKTILIASDHAGFALKEKIKPYLRKAGLQVKDLGTYSKERCDYPEFAALLAKNISQKKYDRGILICKSGIGNSIVANRFPRVRAAVAYSVKATKLSRQHNDSNVLVLGSAFVNHDLSKKIISAWLKTKFEGGRHKRRLGMIKKIEEGITR